MDQSKHIDKMELQDFLALEFNEVLYKDFNDCLKPYYEESSLTFFKTIYRDAIFFYLNYNKITNDVDKYFEKEYAKEDRNIGKLIKRRIIIDIAKIATTNFIWNPGQEKYVSFEPDTFISGRSFPFMHKNKNPSHFIEGYSDLCDFLNGECKHRKEEKFYTDMHQVNNLKKFLETIDIKEKPKEDISESGWSPTKKGEYFPKTHRIKSEVGKLGVKEVKELYNTRDLVGLINETYKREYLNYVRQEEYFPGCPFHIYKKHYQRRKEEYFMIYPGADREEYYFLEAEDQMISELLQLDNENKNNFYSFYPHLKPDPHRKNLELSLEKTRRFIDNSIYNLGHSFYAKGFEDPFDIPLNLPREYWEPQRNPVIEEETNVPDAKTTVLDSEKSLRELFMDPKKYDEVVDRLLSDEIIEKDNKSFRLNTVQLEENKLSEVRAICALGYLLKTKNYLKSRTDNTEIPKALSSFFNTPISKGVYSRAKNQCFLFGADKADDYFKLYLSL